MVATLRMGSATPCALGGDSWLWFQRVSKGFELEQFRTAQLNVIFVIQHGKDERVERIAQAIPLIAKFLAD